MKNKVIYLAGDLCQKGNVLLREKEAEYIRGIEGLEVYSPIEDKEINDKTNQTEESNKYLCDRIYAKDMKAIRESEYITMDLANTSVGTNVELGAIAEFNWFWDNVDSIINSSTEEKTDGECLDKLFEFLEKYPRKKLYGYSTDIRDTNIPETGFFRSDSKNQFSHGALRAASVSGNFEESFEECVRKIEEDGKPKHFECSDLYDLSDLCKGDTVYNVIKDRYETVEDYDEDEEDYGHPLETEYDCYLIDGRDANYNEAPTVFRNKKTALRYFSEKLKEDK